MNGGQIKPGYKRTEVGVIPEDWDAPRLDSLGSGAIPPIKAGPFGSSLTKDQYVADGFKVYGQEQVIRGDHLFGDYFINAQKYRELESCSVRPGDVLLSLVGTAGKLLEVPDDAPPGVINPRLLRLSFDRSKVLPKFFKYQFESELIQSLLSRQAQGGTMGVLNAGTLRPFQVPLPPLFEQRAIATALSDVDALLVKFDRLITKKRDLKQATMQQLLTGQTRLPGFSGEWELKRLGDVADMGSGGTPLSSVAAYYDGDIPWVSISDMTKGGKVIYSTDRYLTEQGFANSAAQMFPAGTVMYAMYASLGECSIAGIPLCTSQAILGIRPRNKLFGEFLFYYLTSLKAIVKTLGQQGAQANLNKGMVQNFQISLPSVEEQIAIATALSDLDTELTTLEARREKTLALKQGMMQQLLTGRIRIIQPFSLG